MTKYIFICLTGFLTSTALAKIDLDQKYRCQVAESNQAEIPVGASVDGLLSLKELRDSGSIRVGHRLVEFYGKLQEAKIQGDIIALTRSYGESVGSVLVFPVTESQIELKFIIAHTLTAIDQTTGKGVFILANIPELFAATPELYKFSCVLPN